MIFKFNKKTKALICVFSSLFFLSSNSFANAASLNMNSDASISSNSTEQTTTDNNINVETNTNVESVTQEITTNKDTINTNNENAITNNNENAITNNTENNITDNITDNIDIQNPSVENSTQTLNAANVNSYEENNSLIKYYGQWTNDTNSRNSSNSAVYSDRPDAYMTFAFTGTGFSLSGYRNNSKGFATINIDGEDHTVDTFSACPIYQAEFFQIDNLTNAKHVVKIKISHEKNASSYGYFVNIDKIDICDGELVPLYESNVYEEDHPYIDYFGNWATDTNASNSNNTAKFSGCTNSCITFQFIGTGFAWYGYANNSKGIANIYIDDVKIQYDTFLNNPEYQRLIFEKENLPNTNHIVRIEVSGERCAQSYGPYLNLDKLVIYEGSLVPICPEVSTYQDDNLHLIYNGNWTKEFNSLNSNQSAKHSSNAGDNVTFAFNGTGFKWYEYANNSKGIAKVYIDDQQPILVDTYTPNENYQFPIYEINNLENKTHIVKIEVSGEQNANSHGKYINIDKIDIFNGIMKSLFPNNYYEQDNSLIQYNNTWNSDTNCSHSNSTSTFSNAQGSSATFKFIGNGFRWYGYANNSKGIAKIYIDGKEYTKDTYQPYIQYQFPFFEILFNERGKHTVTIEVTGTQNELSYGHYINLDSIEIFNGNLISADSISTYEETNPLISFNGNWISDSISKYSNTTGDSISFNFRGTGFVWYGYANNSKGIAEVYVDGIKVSNLDCYSQKQELQKPFFKLEDLENTNHTVEIKVAGQKNPLSYGYYINIDKLDIYDGELIDLN